MQLTALRHAYGLSAAAAATVLVVAATPSRPPAYDTRWQRQRVRYHYRGNAEGSTLRLTLGCLLADELDIELRRVASGRRRTFADGELALSTWMSENAFVCWLEHSAPWDVEQDLIARYDLPLNLDQNKHNRFHPELSAARRQAKQRAAKLPVLPK